MKRYGLMVLLPFMLSGCEWFNKNFHDRLLFIEESHIGLKAKVGAEHPPADIDFGYRRTIVTLIPKADASGNTADSAEIEKKKKELLGQLDAAIKEATDKASAKAVRDRKSADETQTMINAAAQEARSNFLANRNVVIGESPNCPGELLDRSEPLSVISSFNADIRWFEATKVRTYFATGTAATRTACDLNAIKALVATPND
jgi:hypothetical protein